MYRAAYGAQHRTKMAAENKRAKEHELWQEQKQAAKKPQQQTKQSTDQIFMQKSVPKADKRGTTGGFFANRELARVAGQKGGRISRRVKKTA